MLTKLPVPYDIFNQEKALAEAFSVITNLRMELFEALVLTITAWNGNQTFNWAAKNMVVINRDKFLSLKMLLGNISIKNIWFIFGSPSLSDQMDHGQQGQGKLELIVAVQFKIS